MSVQEIIKSRRLELGLTLKDVAKVLGVAEATVSRYETGDIQNMGIDKISNLARALHCSPAYLMGWTDDPRVQQVRPLELNETEYELIAKFREMTPAEQAIVLRSVGINL